MKQLTPHLITPVSLKQWLHDGDEIAVLDVREHGQYGEEHLFYVVSTPYSRLENEVQRLVPRKQVRMVLIGDESAVLTLKAFKRLSEIGYTHIHVLDGAMPAWKKAGFEVFAGVNLPSKAFGELAEHAFNTPRISAIELNEKIQNKENLVILDGRPYSEYKKMSIPTAICCPNGELPLRIDDIVTSPETTIVINCAGRTRSIIGAQTLINLGIPNKILALENGTQGWFLADLKLDHGQTRRHPQRIDEATLTHRQQRARELAQKHGVKFIENKTVAQWQRDKTRTTYICDVRTPEEYAQGTVAGAQHCPGGQLIQATDQYVGVKGARLVLVDNEGVRAPAVASWLAMLGWDVSVWSHAFEQTQVDQTKTQENIKESDIKGKKIKELLAEQIDEQLKAGALLIDIRPSMQYRTEHIKFAKWSIRPQLHLFAEKLPGKTVVLLAEDKIMARLAAKDLEEYGAKTIYINTQNVTDWKAAGLPMQASPEYPSNEHCIDYLFFVHDRHDGNKEAAKQYLAWEINLLAQIDQQEISEYKLPT